MELFKYHNNAIEKLKSFSGLRDGWHFGEGFSPTDDTIRMAAVFIERASLALMKTDVFPGAYGEIQVSIYFKNYYLEFIIELSGNVTFVLERDDIELKYIEDLSFNSALEELSAFRKQLCNYSSGLSTQITSINSDRDLPAWHSETLPLPVGVYPFSIQNALLNPETPYANISGHFMHPLQANLQSSGFFHWRNSKASGPLSNIQANPVTCVMAT